VSPDDPFLDRKAIEAAFRRLGDRLARRGIVADIYVFGGAAMALTYNARRATHDIDAVFQPHGVVLERPEPSPTLGYQPPDSRGDTLDWENPAPATAPPTPRTARHRRTAWPVHGTARHRRC
jgi:Nucleotidyltransferase of unknown function (DUF6036)